jgi:ubiquinone/menaquinone biosynthesis C-methylase UbiE
MFHPRGPTVRELLVQGFSSIERGYDLLAPKFDYTPFRTPDAVLEQLAARLARRGPVESALDVCCGTGAVMQHLRPLVLERLVGVDLSWGMLGKAEQNLARVPGSARVELVQGDALALPFEEEFELVTCFGAFGHILEKDEPRFVAQVARALRPGGRFVFVTYDMPSRLEPAYWAARGFNAAMRVRNALWRSTFVMYYLTFLLPRARQVLEEAGLSVEAQHGVFGAPFERLVLVTATRPPALH